MRLDSLEQQHAGTDFSELRSRVLAGRRGAWRQFIERYSRTVFAFAMRLAGGQRGGEETVQQVYLRVFERLTDNDYRILRTFRGDARFETYLFTVVRNEVAAVRKRGRAQGLRQIPYSESPPSADPGQPGFSESIGLDPARVVAIVNDALGTLHPRERLVLRLRFGEGFTYRRLAQELDWKDTNAAAYEVCKILRKLDVLDGCRLKLRWGEPEQDVVLECIRRWLETDSRRRGPSVSEGADNELS